MVLPGLAVQGDGAAKEGGPWAPDSAASLTLRRRHHLTTRHKDSSTLVTSQRILALLAQTSHGPGTVPSSALRVK